MKTGQSASVAPIEKECSVRFDFGSLEIKETECFFIFKCIHIDFPGKEIMQATLINTALDFDASYEELGKKNIVLFRKGQCLTNVGSI